MSKSDQFFEGHTKDRSEIANLNTKGDTASGEIVHMFQPLAKGVKIYLFELGYIYGVNLKKVAKIVNINPDVIQTVVGDPVRNIGNPNLSGVAYSDDRIFSCFPKLINECVVIGIVSAPLKHNHYARQSDPNLVVISLYQAEEMCKRTDRTLEEYIAQDVVTRFLHFQYRYRKPSMEAAWEIWHEATRGCIFDFCTYKPDKLRKLQFGHIDDMCKSKLIEANVPESIISTVDSVLRNIHKITFLKFVRTQLQQPIFSVLFGGVIFGVIINLLSSLLLGDFDSKKDFTIAGIILLIALLMSVGYYYWTIVIKKFSMR